MIYSSFERLLWKLINIMTTLSFENRVAFGITSKRLWNIMVNSRLPNEIKWKETMQFVTFVAYDVQNGNGHDENDQKFLLFIEFSLVLLIMEMVSNCFIIGTI